MLRIYALGFIPAFVFSFGEDVRTRYKQRLIFTLKIYFPTYVVQGVQKKTALFKKLITFYVFVLGYSNRLQSKEHELYFCYRATFSRFHRILDTLVRHESRAKF